MKNVFFSVLFFSFSLISFSFAETEENQELLSPVKLQLHLTSGSSWDQDYEMSAIIRVNEKEVTSTILHFKIHFEVEGESEEGIIVLAVPFEFSAQIKFNDFIRMTSIQEYARTLEDGFARCIFSQYGALIDVQNMDGFIHKFKQIVSGCSLEKNGVSAHFNDIDNFIHSHAKEIIKVMSGFAHYCPRRAVNQGDEWTVLAPAPLSNESILKSNVKIEMNSKCTERKNGEVVIKNDHSSCSEDPKNPLSQSISSLLRIEEKTGWLNQGELFYRGSKDGMSREIFLRTRKL